MPIKHAQSLFIKDGSGIELAQSEIEFKIICKDTYYLHFIS